MTETDPFRQRAEDLAALAHVSVDEAAAALRDSLRRELPPLVRMRRLPWHAWVWLQWIPVRWQQRYLLRRIHNHELEDSRRRHP